MRVRDTALDPIQIRRSGGRNNWTNTLYEVSFGIVVVVVVAVVVVVRNDNDMYLKKLNTHFHVGKILMAFLFIVIHIFTCKRLRR